MKILVIGDPHGSEKVRKIPLKGIDMILLTGDIGKADLARKFAFENVNRLKQGLPEKEYTPSLRKAVFREVHSSTVNLLKYLSKHAPVYFIQGNVKVPTGSELRKEEKKYGIKIPNTRKAIDSMTNVHLVNNRLRVLNGLRIGFLEYFIDTSWVREFKPSNYKERMKEAKKDTDKAKRVLRNFKNLDILLCHQPPYGVLDKVNFPKAPKHWQGKHAGSKAILDYIKKKQPRYVFCGHIHEGKGKKKVGKTIVHNAGVAGDYVLLDI
jgi:Icc-related predicted phosphoesterase